MLGRLFGKPKPAPILLRDTLFGDLPPDHWPPDKGGGVFPWSAFAAARDCFTASDPAGAVEQWSQIVNTPGLEPRHYLQAWHFLRQQGHQPPSEIAKQVLGVIVEVGMPNGLDLLAAYPDHAARYYNYSGAGVVWEHPDASLDTLIDELLSAATVVVARIGPWEKHRSAPPPNGQMRLSFLTPSGLHFGQAPMNALAADPLAGRVVQCATRLMQALIAKTSRPA